MLLVLLSRFVICSIFALQYVIADGDEKPNYKIVWDKLTKEIESDVVALNLTFERRDNNVIVSGEVKQLVDLDDDWKVDIVILRSEESGGEYKRFAMIPQMGVCALCKRYYKMYFYESLKDYANAPDPDMCPVKQETYVVKDYPMDINKLNKISLKPGFYRIVGVLSKDKVEKNKYTVDCHVEEDK